MERLFKDLSTSFSCSIEKAPPKHLQCHVLLTRQADEVTHCGVITIIASNRAGLQRLRNLITNANFHQRKRRNFPCDCRHKLFHIVLEAFRCVYRYHGCTVGFFPPNRVTNFTFDLLQCVLQSGCKDTSPFEWWGASFADLYLEKNEKQMASKLT